MGVQTERARETQTDRHTDRHRQRESERERERMEDSVKNIQEYTDTSMSLVLYIHTSISAKTG